MMLDDKLAEQMADDRGERRKAFECDVTASREIAYRAAKNGGFAGEMFGPAADDDRTAAPCAIIGC